MNNYLKLLPLAATPILLNCTDGNKKKENKPNVIMFLIDDLGSRDFSCYGSEFYQTPNIDKLAKDGVKFTNAYAACTVSSPTRGALMTGKYPARTHITDWIAGWDYKHAKLTPPQWTQHLPLEEKTLPEYLKEADYQTWHVGKWHLGDDEKYWPEGQGFDVNIAGNLKGSPNKNKKMGANGYFSPYGLERIENGPEGEYLTDRLTDEAINLISKRDKEKPFFLNLCHYAVHTPLDGKPEKIEKYENLVDSSYFQTNTVYAAMLESVDESLQRVVAKLENDGLLDNTIILITSDNGALKRITGSTPLREGKGSYYEGGVRVPMIAYWKGKFLSNKTNDTPIITMDLFSTILDAAGVEVTDNNIDGKSLLPIVRGGKEIADRPLYWHYPHYHKGGASPYSSVRLGDWKLIRTYENNIDELYNLSTDLGETNNLIESHQNKAKELSNLLEDWLKSVDAQFATDNPNYDKNKLEVMK